MTKKSFLLIIIQCSVLIFFVSAQAVTTDLSIRKIKDLLIDDAGKTINGIYGDNINGVSFQQEVLVSANGFQYIVYYNDNDRVCLARRNLKTDKIEIIRFLDYIYRGGDNTHCTISVGICLKDGTIHLAFDHHNNELHYKKSIQGLLTKPSKYVWNESLFTRIANKLSLVSIPVLCYPRFVHLPDGNLQFIYRIGGSGGGDRIMVTYNPKSGSWENQHQIDSRKGSFTDCFGTSTSRCSYPNSYTYDRFGNLHNTFVWRESSVGSNHDLMYVWSKDRGNTWLNNTGDMVGTLDLVRLVTVESAGIKVWDITRKESLMNSQAQDVDSNGAVHTVMWHKRSGFTYEKNSWWTPEQASYYHYWRDQNAVWHQNELPFTVGNRPKMYFDKNDNALLVYLEKWEATDWFSSIYFNKGTLVIAAATKKNNWKDWSIIHKEKGPFLNEVLVDPLRIKRNGILSVFLQESPSEVKAPANIKILEYCIQNNKYK